MQRVYLKTSGSVQLILRKPGVRCTDADMNLNTNMSSKRLGIWVTSQTHSAARPFADHNIKSSYRASKVQFWYQFAGTYVNSGRSQYMLRIASSHTFLPSSRAESMQMLCLGQLASLAIAKLL
ncbi:hypothetical protein ABBQ32_012439 [Trebouxia sp. C0010 RCD-2024]